MRIWIVLLFLLSALHSMAQLNWARRVGAWSNDAYNSMVIDSTGNTYVAGEFGGTITLPTGTTITSIGSLDILIAKYDAAGQMIWSKNFGNSGLDRAVDLALTPAGELVVTGVFMGTVQFDGSTVTSSGGTMDMFLLKMSGLDGSIDWVTQGGSANGADQPNSISVAPDGSIAITGEFFGTAVFGTNSLTSLIDPDTGTSSMDIFVAKYSATGSVLWVKHGAAEYADRGMTVAHDLAGNVYVAGQFSDTISFDVTHNNAMYSAIFLICFDQAGNEQWFRVFGGGTYNQVFDLVLVEGNRLMLVGDMQGTVIFLDAQPDMFTAVAPHSSFIVEVDLQGEFLRQTTWGSDHVVNTRSVSVQGNEIVVFGRFQCQFTDFSTNYGSGTWLATGQHDLYVARFQLNDHSFKDAQQFGGQGNKVPGSIVHTPAGAPLFCGSFAYLLVFPSEPFQFDTTPIVNALNVANAPSPYCADPFYGSYVGLRGSALLDAFIAKGFTEGREPYDIFSRTGSVCDRSQKDAFISLGGQGVVGPDSLEVCAQATLGVNTYTAYHPDTAIKHNAPDLSFLWNTGSVQPTLPITATGWYSVSVTSMAGCWARNDSVHVTVHPLPPAPLVSDDVVVNVQASPTQPITGCEPFGPMLWATGIAPADQLVWTGPGISSTNDTIQATTSGWHTATVTTPFGCTRLTSTLVTIIPAGPLPPLEADYVINFPQDDDLNDTIYVCDNVMLGYTTDVSLSLNGQPVGLPYGVTDLYSCDGFFWGQSYYDLQNYSCTDPITQEGWYNVSIDVMLTNAPCGEDTLIFTRQDSVYVIPYPVTYPTVSLTAPGFLCPGDTVTATMVCTDCDQINWSGVLQSFVDSAWIVSPGGVSVNVIHTDTNNCSTSATSSASVIWNPNPQLNVLPVDGVICPDSTAQIFTNSQGISYQWFGPFGPIAANNDTIITSQQGIYYLEMVDLLNCLVTSDPVLVTDYATPYLSVLPDNMICEDGDIATLQVITTSTATLQWWEPLSGNALQQIVNQPGIYNVSVNGCGITTVLSVEIYGNTAVAELQDIGPYNLCTGADLLLEANPGMPLYYWLPGPVFSPNLLVQQPGTYTLVAQDIYGCQDSIMVTVEAITPVPIDIGPDTLICPGGIATFESPIGFTDPLWNSISSSSTFTTSAEGIVTLVVTDINGCSTSDSALVELYQFTEWINDSTFTICLGENVSLTVDGIGAISWFADPALTDLIGTGGSYPLIQPQDDAVFFVTQAEGMCISPAAQIDLVVVPPPQPVSINAPDSICEGLSLIISMIGDTSYTAIWNTPMGSISDQEIMIPEVTTAHSGVYSLTPYNAGCPGDSASATVVVMVPIPIDLGPDTSFCQGSEFVVLLPPGNAQPVWSTGGTATSITISEGGTYSVSAIDSQGCETSGGIELEMIDCDLVVPNVFTPNGDGINDTWMLGDGPYRTAALVVYDRWGDVVWRGDITRTGFNGKHYQNGSLLSEGTYFYALSIERTHERMKEQHGYLQIIR